MVPCSVRVGLGVWKTVITAGSTLSPRAWFRES